MKKGEKREKTRARDTSRAMAVVILVLKEEGAKSAKRRGEDLFFYPYSKIDTYGRWNT